MVLLVKLDIKHPSGIQIVIVEAEKIKELFSGLYDNKIFYDIIIILVTQIADFKQHLQQFL